MIKVPELLQCILTTLENNFTIDSKVLEYATKKTISAGIYDIYSINKEYVYDMYMWYI